ncbi:hypothetical protein [Alkalimarinus coralli]|uniref:hypothetical protein n=1 Tax=Alkalimarinus coralli TaxID=2935863 RepID=UPI00202B3761|nr:hypothetical protein [Alkalimarinus coralli]
MSEEIYEQDKIPADIDPWEPVMIEKFGQYVRTVKGDDFECPMCNNDGLFQADGERNDKMNFEIICGRCAYVMSFKFDLAKELLEGFEPRYKDGT